MRLLVCVLTLVAASTATAAARPLFGPAAIPRLVNVDEPAISPDGKAIAAVVVRQDVQRARYVNSLVLVRADDGAVRTLVRGRDVAVPRWAPDGRALAYVARTARAGTRQLFVRRAAATQQLTAAAADVIDFAWSPDGRQIAYVAADPAAGGAFFYAGDNDYTAAALTPPDHLWVVPAAGGRSRRLTRGSWTIAPTDPGGIFSPQIAWTHDGRSITLTRVENTFSGDSERSALWNVDAVSGAMRKLTQHSELELSPAYSPGGGSLTYWYPLGGDFNSENTLRLIAGGNDSNLTARLDRNIAGARWFPDGRHLLICAADHTQMTAWTVDLGGGVAPFPTGDLHIVCDPYSSATFDSGIDADIARDGSIAFVATSATRARELYLLRPGATIPRQLTHFNDFLSSFAIGRMEQLEWTGPGGFAENGVVTYPATPANPRSKAPIVLLIHGGPGLSSTRDFAWEQWPLAQTIASRGYVVLQPNYRGS
ncbi:MAG: S9 family peptidase, partial [Candidatus Eremiobacteraeota bacterium]|nr:S9 family peptidase [Candidatus Eremiobacteraeota bacterium]